MREEWKVFGVNEFHFSYKETIEGVCHKAVTHLFSKRVGMEGIGHKGFSHLLQREDVWKVFVVREIHICYKERSMQGVCHNSVTQIVQREEWGCMS